MMLERDIEKLGTGSTEEQRLTVARKVHRLSQEVSSFLSEAIMHLGPHDPDDIDSTGSGQEEDVADEDISDRMDNERPYAVVLPLPSSFGHEKCKRIGVESLVDVELRLRQGQANDALHELRMALADKAVLYQTEVRHSRNYDHRTRASAKVRSVQAQVRRHVAAYRKCRRAMVVLGADDTLLDRYQSLTDDQLKVETVAISPNARGHRNETLAWFWSMDILRDTDRSQWMSECKLTA